MTSFYEPILDLLSTRPGDDDLERARDLCIAVEAEDGPKITMTAATLVRRTNPRFLPHSDIPKEAYYEAMSRVLLLGERTTLESLLGWYERPISFATSTNSRQAEHWNGIIERLPVADAPTNPAELRRSIRRAVSALRVLIPIHASFPRKKPDLSYAHSGASPPDLGYSPSLPDALDRAIARLVELWMVAHHAELEQAIATHSARPDDGAKLLQDVATRRRLELRALFEDKGLKRSARLARVPIPLSVVRYGSDDRHTYLDFFERQGPRRFEFEAYDRDPHPEPPLKSIRLAELTRGRMRQLAFLLDEYGLPTDDGKTSPPTTARPGAKVMAARRKIITGMVAQGVPLDLASDAGLIRFTTELFLAEAKAGARGQAARATLTFLRRYLNNLTVHSDFNLAEHPIYIGRAFPRAVTGAQLHDCGVHAVRLVYLFGRFTHAIGVAPEISFICLPLHVGLHIEMDGFPTIICHNEVLFTMEGHQVTAARGEWDSKPEPSDSTSMDALDDKFWEDVAAQLFLRDADQPIRRVPLTGLRQRSPRPSDIWTAYRREVVRAVPRLLSADIDRISHNNFEFDLRFLFALHADVAWFDRHVVPLWNLRGHGLWKRSEALLQKMPSRRRSYANELDASVTEVEDAYVSEVLPVKRELTKDLRASPSLVGPRAQRITVAERLSDFAATQVGPTALIRDHIHDTRQAVAPGTSMPVPPFAEEADLLSPRGG